MFGQDGLNKTIELFKDISHKWKKHHDFAFGVFYRKDVIYLIRLEKAGAGWILEENAMIPFPLDEESAADKMELMAERTASVLEVMGWPSAPVALCLDPEEAFSCTTHVPDMNPKELASAIHWELEGQHDFEGAEFLSASYSLPNDEGQWAAAIPESLAEDWKTAWSNNGLELLSLTVMPPALRKQCYLKDMCLQIGTVSIPAKNEPYDVFYEDGGWEALYAAEALCHPQSQKVDFLDGEHAASSGWNWKALSTTVTAVVFLGLFSCFLFDEFGLHTAREALTEQQNQLALLSQEKTEKALLEQALISIDKKQQLLLRLSGHDLPWRSIFIHLGTMTVDGVWLSDITSLTRNSLEIRGKATGYESLAEFLQKFEEDRDFFPQPPLLKSSNTEKGPGNQAAICFQLQLSLAPEDEVHEKA